MAKENRAGPPFRAEHVGSLLRPAELRAAYRDFTAGRTSAEDFSEVLDRSIRDVVEMQERIGLRAVGDGEFRRVSYWAHFVEATEGLGVAPARFAFHDGQGREAGFLAPRVEGAVRRGRPISGGEFDFLKSVARRTVKVTIPSPPTMHFWAEPGAAGAAGYSGEEAFFADLARVYQEEIAALAASGATYIQIDEVPLAMLCDPRLREKALADGEQPDAIVAKYIALINAALDGRPAGMTVAVHLCRGNFKGQWLSGGGYGAVAERIFNGLEVDAFFLEYDTPRAGDFKPLALVPEPKQVVLGLVSSKRAELETAEDLIRRIEEAGRFMPVERLALSPQCGFASTVAGNPVTEAVQWAKLRLVVEVADRVWG